MVSCDERIVGPHHIAKHARQLQGTLHDRRLSPKMSDNDPSADTDQFPLPYCEKKLETPPDNERYCKHAPLSPKDSNFVYHDDTV